MKLTKDNFDYFQNKYIEKANEQKQYYKSIENSSLSRKVIFNKKASQLNELIDFYKLKTINKMFFLDTTPEFLPEFPKIEQIIFSNVRIVPIPNLDSVASYKLKNDLLKKYISQSLTFQNDCLLQIKDIEKAKISITEAKIAAKEYYQKAIDIEKKNSNYLMYIDRQCCSFIEVLIENKKDLSKLPENWEYYLEKVNSKKNSSPKDPK